MKKKNGYINLIVVLNSKTIVKLPVKEKNGKYTPYSEKTQRFVYGADMITKWCNQLSK